MANKKLDQQLCLFEDDIIGPVGGDVLDTAEPVPSCPFCGILIRECSFYMVTLRYANLVGVTHSNKDGTGIVHKPS